MEMGDARNFQVNLTDEFTDEELKNKYTEMMSIAGKSYKPVARGQLRQKIESLFGSLSEKFFNLPTEDQDYLASHGGLNVF